MVRHNIKYNLEVYYIFIVHYYYTTCRYYLFVGFHRFRLFSTQIPIRIHTDYFHTNPNPNPYFSAVNSKFRKFLV